MSLTWDFILSSILLGTGLAMDAFSVSAAEGLRVPSMKWGARFRIAGTFAFFQFLMPVLGWAGVRTVVRFFSSFMKAVPWIALILLGYIGGKMLLEGIRDRRSPEPAAVPKDPVRGGTLLMLGIATSIDALSAGFALAHYSPEEAFLAGLIIAFVTLLICLFGLRLGRLAGAKLQGSAQIFGGSILILIGLSIFIRAFM